MSNGVCTHPLHLTFNDRRLLHALEVSPWPCPACEASRDSADAPAADVDVDEFETDGE